MAGFFGFLIHRLSAIFVGVISIYFIFPLGLLLSSPLFLYRRVIFSIASFVRPDLGKMASSGSAFANVDKIYKSCRGRILVTLMMEGSPPIELLKTRVKSVVTSTHPKTGDLQYPEMFQAVTQWMGFSFWKPVVDFNLDDHLSLALEGSPVTHEQAMRFIKDKTLTPVHKDQPVWKLYLIPDYIPEENTFYRKPHQKYSILIYSAEHILADGFSITKFLLKLAGQRETQDASSKQSKKSEGGKLSIFPKVLFTLPLDVGSWLIDVIFGDKKMWDESRDCEEKQSQLEQVVCESGTDLQPLVKEDAYAMQTSPVTSFEDIRSVAKLHGVSTFAVIFAATVGALQYAKVLTQDKREHENRKLQFYTPIPRPGHPDKLRNHRILAVYAIPMKEKDPILRLKQIDEYLKIMKHSTLPLFFHWVHLFLGSLPSCAIFKFHRASGNNPTVVLSSFPGPKEEHKFVVEDCVIKEISLMGGMSIRSKSIVLALITNGGKFRLVTSADKSVLAENQAQRICEGFLETLNVMLKSYHSSTVISNPK